MKKLQLYLETSVWNFYFADDAPEKREITVLFFERVKTNSCASILRTFQITLKRAQRKLFTFSVCEELRNGRRV
jgi:hypothetical protein